MGKESSCLKEVVGEVQVEMRSLESIRSYRKENRIFSETPNTQLAQQEENSEPVLSGLGKKDSRDGKGSKLVTSGTKRKVAALLSGQQL